MFSCEIKFDLLIKKIRRRILCIYKILYLENENFFVFCEQTSNDFTLSSKITQNKIGEDVSSFIKCCLMDKFSMINLALAHVTLYYPFSSSSLPSSIFTHIC